MNKERKCLVGHDSDDGLGWLVGILIAIAIAIMVIITIISIMVFLGAFIGGFHSIKNYFIALKHNVLDSNLKRAHAN